METNIDFSIVVPVYNSEKTLNELYLRLKETFRVMNSSFEVIFVNDCSRDNSIQVLYKVQKENNNVTVIDFFKNSGQHNAILCGFNNCIGKYVITIDDDLQNPPEEIPKLYHKIQEGYDAVFGSYEIKRDKWYKNFGSLFIQKMNSKIFNVNNKLTFSSFRILTKELVDQIKDIKTPFPYISGMILNSSFNVANQIVEHREREYGKSNYTIKKLINLSFNLIINYSSIPIKLVIYSGLIFTSLSIIIALYFIIQKLNNGQAPSGWTSIIVLISFYNFIFLGVFMIFGIYISRILKGTSGFRQFAVKKVVKSKA